MSKSRIGWITYLGEDPRAALERAKSLGFDNVQTGWPGLEWANAKKMDELKTIVDESGVDITVLFVCFPEEDYSSIAAIHGTGGFLPPEYREIRYEMAMKAADMAKHVGIPGIAAHLGFIPDDKNHPDYQFLLKVVKDVAAKCKELGLTFSFETGQEKATVLKGFIDDIGHDNAGVNFDPANMILYGSGEPLEAIDLLGPHVLGVHAKDAKWAAPEVRGKEWGTETTLGEGDVDFPKLLEKIKSFGYTGPITIEREFAGDRQAEEVQKARTLLESLL